jgi:ElaB/YqjD/DUF883 family membrane-anchored ribosome-binding protein
MQTSTEKKHANGRTRASAAHLNNGVNALKKDIDMAATHIKDDLGNLAYHAGIQARQFVGKTEKNVTDLADSVSSRISDKPLQSSLIAMGVGILFGAFLFRR